MIKNGIVAYTFLLKLKNRDTFIQLNKQIDFKNKFNEFISQYSEISDDNDTKKLFSVTKLNSPVTDDTDFQYFPFLVTSGSYGIEASITDRITKKVEHKKTKNEADMKNFVCLIAVPNDKADINNTKGLIFFQTIGTYGIKIITTNYFNKFFSQYGLTFISRHILLKKLAKEIIKKGIFNEITVTKNKISPDLCDNIIQSSGTVKTTYLKPKIKQSWLNQLFDKISNNSTENLLEFEDVTYNNIEIKFQYNERSRTIKLQDMDSLSFPIDLPDGISEKKDSEQEIIKFIVSLAKDYKNHLILNEKDKK